MANQQKGTQVDLSESSVYADKNPDPVSNRSDDFATDTALDRLELITGGAEEPAIAEGELGQKFDELDASTEEELDALEVNLYQEDERPNSREGSGLIVDDAAEERIARFTESDPMQSKLGAISVVPGRDDTSSILRHHSETSIAHPNAVVDENSDEPMNETVDDRNAEESAAG
jgi:transcription termination/antitermination protein NusA